MKAEENNIIDSKTFSGMGKKISFTTKSGKVVTFSKKHDPTERLKKLAGVSAPKKDKKKGGFLAPLAVGVLSSVAGSLAGKLFELVKEKIQGKGYSIDPELFKTDAHKKAFLKHILH